MPQLQREAQRETVYERNSCIYNMRASRPHLALLGCTSLLHDGVLFPGGLQTTRDSVSVEGVWFSHSRLNPCHLWLGFLSVLKQCL